MEINEYNVLKKKQEFKKCYKELFQGVLWHTNFLHLTNKKTCAD